MDPITQRRIVEILDEHRILTLATLRPDGWPQATIVGYANDGLAIYFLVSRESQKFANIVRDPRVSIAIGDDTPNPEWIDGLSMAARVSEAQTTAERGRALDLMLLRYPEYAAYPREAIEAMAVLRADPTVISVLDYTKGFGHTELVKVEPADLKVDARTRTAAAE